MILSSIGCWYDGLFTFSEFSVQPPRHELHRPCLQHSDIWYTMISVSKRLKVPSWWLVCLGTLHIDSSCRLAERLCTDLEDFGTASGCVKVATDIIRHLIFSSSAEFFQRPWPLWVQVFIVWPFVVVLPHEDAHSFVSAILSSPHLGETWFLCGA